MDFSSLTAEQLAAATSSSPRNLVLAGPGSGKTRTLIFRILHMIEKGTAPKRIIAITFTNAAAKEVAHRLKEAGAPGLGYIGTLHGYCLRILQDYGKRLGYGPKISIIEPADAEELIEDIAKEMGLKIGPKLKKARETFPRGGRPRTPEETAVATFRKRLREKSMVDFDTILWDTAELLKLETAPAAPVDLIVDEFQDSGEADFLIYEHLNAESHFYVGDPDQAIYSFRGGRLENILQIARHSSFTLHLLEGNFRSGRKICDLAQRLIEFNRDRAAKRTLPRLEAEGTIIIQPAFPTDQAEAAGIASSIRSRINRGYDPMEMAVLARSNAQVRLLAEALKAGGVQIRERRLRRLPLDLPKARLALEVLNNPDNELTTFRWIRETLGSHSEIVAKRDAAKNMTTRVGKYIPDVMRITEAAQIPEALARMKISRDSIEWIMEKAEEMVEPTLQEVVLAVAQETAVELEMGEGVTVTTIHAAKGREWGMVVLAGMEQEQIPGKRAAKEPASLEEERRLFYVGITRAKELLVLTQAESRRQPWGRQDYAPTTPSQFLAEIQPITL